MNFNGTFLSHRLQQFLTHFKGYQATFSNYLTKRRLEFCCTVKKYLKCSAANCMMFISRTQNAMRIFPGNLKFNPYTKIKYSSKNIGIQFDSNVDDSVYAPKGVE